MAATENSKPRIRMKLLPYDISVCRLDNPDAVPDWAEGSEFHSITKTPDETSIVCESRFVPENVESEGGWAMLKVIGPLDFDLTGVLSRIISPLGDGRISIFAISTYETDYILIKKERVEAAIGILEKRFDVTR